MAELANEFPVADQLVEHPTGKIGTTWGSNPHGGLRFVQCPTFVTNEFIIFLY